MFAEKLLENNLRRKYSQRNFWKKKSSNLIVLERTSGEKIIEKIICKETSGEKIFEENIRRETSGEKTAEENMCRETS